jgi:uncharacterized LabA/DUF88 family protein
MNVTYDPRAEREQKYAFIDSRHVLTNYNRNVAKWFPEKPELDFARMIGPLGASRSFYYDCIDNLHREGETDADYEIRLKSQYAELNRVRNARGCHIRLGVLKGGKNKTEKRQKEIDVLIAVDMLTHAAQKNMRTAILVTGDQDLKPAVESLVQLGVFVELHGDAKGTSRELTWAASAYNKLTFDEYFNWSTERLVRKYPIPTKTSGFVPVPEAVLATATAGEYNLELLKTEGPSEYGIRIKMADDGRILWAHNEVERLKLYADIVLGRINWLENKS